MHITHLKKPKKVKQNKLTIFLEKKTIENSKDYISSNKIII
jgi:hypothetical protein